jgi:uncharacterized phosphosugar-binding protein
MDAAYRYIDNIKKMIESLEGEGMGPIEDAARLIASSLAEGGMLRAFGTGHSHMFALEIFYRAGGLARVAPLLEEGLMLHAGAAKSTVLERLPGYAEILLDQARVAEGDVIIIASNSGRNAAPIEMALAAKKRGLSVIALTSMKHTRSVSSRHESGKLLYECADVVLDNRGCVGDASVEISRLGKKVSPTSTVLGSLMLNAAVARAIEIMAESGGEPEVFSSSNVDSGDAINEAYVEKYRGVVKSL